MKCKTELINVFHPIISISFDDSFYIFNAPEGTQRFCYSNGIRFSKLKAVFCNKVKPANLGGLPGLLITVSEAKTISELSVIGPGGLSLYVSCTKKIYKNKKGMNVHVKDIYQDSETVVYKDGNLTVDTFLIYPDPNPNDHSDAFKLIDVEKRKEFFNDYIPRKRQKELKDKTLSFVSQGGFLPTKFNEKKAQEMGVSGKNLGILSRGESITLESGETVQPCDIFIPKIPNMIPTQNMVEQIVCFISQVKTIPGKFDAKKAASLGVFGRNRGILCSGQSVTLESGVIVQPSHVIGPAKPGAIIIVLDCPSVEYIQSLITNPKLDKCLSDKENPASIVYHQCGTGVLNDQRYQSWLKKSCCNSKNIFISPGLNQADYKFDSCAHFMKDLYKIDKDLFPLLPDTPKPVFHLEQELEKNSNNYVVGRQRMVHSVEPVVSLLNEKYIPAYTPVVDLSSVQELIDEMADAGNIEGYTDEFVVPLGTGSAVPCRYRNVSSTYVHHSTGGVLFDAGEGTLGQLEKRFGQELRDRLRALKLVFISHIHGDHVLGLANVVFAWIAVTNGTTDKLIIVATGAVFEWLRHLAYFENTLDDFLTRLVLVNAVSLKQGESDDQGNDLEPFKDSIFEKVRVARVYHCDESYAMSLTYRGGFKVSFSGDCRPSDEFARIGQDSDLLIHEATFPDNMYQDARIKRHCTNSEAIGIGRRMQAKCVLLTHFSQRVSKVYSLPTPLDSVPGDKDKSQVGMAVDMSTIPLRNFNKLRLFNNRRFDRLFGSSDSELLDFDLDNLDNLDDLDDLDGNCITK